MKTCTVHGCNIKKKCVDLCSKHYARKIRTGSALSNTRRYSLNKSLSEKMEVYTNKTIYCWEWTGCKTKKGYGQLNINRKRKTAHRISWELANGKIPKGMFVMHKCDNPSCVNPNHLLIGTAKENSEDMVKKGRSLKGEKQNRARLKETDVSNIRKLIADGKTSREIGNMFSVSRGAINHIKRGSTWSWLV